MKSDNRSKHVGLRNLSKNSDDVAKYYDNRSNSAHIYAANTAQFLWARYFARAT